MATQILCIFTPICGEDEPILTIIFLNGLKPPTSNSCKCFIDLHSLLQMQFAPTKKPVVKSIKLIPIRPFIYHKTSTINCKVNISPRQPWIGCQLWEIRSWMSCSRSLIFKTRPRCMLNNMCQVCHIATPFFTNLENVLCFCSYEF